MGLFSLDWVSHPLLAGYVYWIMDAISRKSVKKGTKNIRLLSLPYSKNKKKLRILNDWSVYLKLNFKGPTQNHPKKWFIGKLNRYYISIHFPYLIKKISMFFIHFEKSSSMPKHLAKKWRKASSFNLLLKPISLQQSINPKSCICPTTEKEENLLEKSLNPKVLVW